MSLVGWILLLLVVAAIGYVVFTRRRAVRRPRNRVVLPEPTPADDDLATFGLSEVRVATKRETPLESARPVERPGEPAPKPVRETPERSERDEPRPVAASPRAASALPAAIRPGTGLWDEDDPSAAHLLASLAAHVGGTAAVLRFDDGAYVVEALAGVDKSLPDPIGADDCPLHRAQQDRVLTVLPNDLKGLRALGDPPRAYARALAEPPAARTFLVVGTPEVDEDPEALARIDRYADLLASITDLDTSDADTSADAPTVPRAAIIREEQEAAREADRPLAFALVTLADAEERLTEHTPEDVARAEADLHERLTDAPSVHRVEPFGDLLVGAFLDLTPEEMAEWCTELASSDPPLFIGAVAPAKGAPEAIRDAAAEALRDAYDQRRAQIVAA